MSLLVPQCVVDEAIDVNKCKDPDINLENQQGHERVARCVYTVTSNQ